MDQTQTSVWTMDEQSFANQEEIARAAARLVSIWVHSPLVGGIQGGIQKRSAMDFQENDSTPQQ